MNILGIDYGLKNVGFAIGEQITNSCSTYFSKKFKNRKELIEKIKNLITEWDINTIVIGLPLNMDNTESEMSLEIRNFSKKLEKACTNVVENGFMTKDLAILVGMNQNWMKTEDFIKKISENLSELI